MQLRKLTAVLATSALVAGGGIGVAQAASGTDGNSSAQQVRAGKRGPTTAQLKALADKLGVTTAQLKAAMDATRPAAPAKGDGKRGDLAADLATALGVKQSAVQEILDANRPAKPAERPANGTRPPKPGSSKLVAALATGLKLDKATVQAAFDKLEAAHDADHAKREAAMAAALAKQLGLDADDVAAALEATRPAKPAARG